MKTGTELIREIDSCILKKDEMAFWWLGQLGFAVKLGEKVLYFDVFISEHPKRKIPHLLKP